MIYKDLVFLHSHLLPCISSFVSSYHVLSTDDLSFEYKYNTGNKCNQKRSISSSPFHCHLLPTSVDNFHEPEDVFVFLRPNITPTCKPIPSQGLCFVLRLSLFSINLFLSVSSLLSA